MSTSGRVLGAVPRIVCGTEIAKNHTMTVDLHNSINIKSKKVFIGVMGNIDRGDSEGVKIRRIYSDRSRFNVVELWGGGIKVGNRFLIKISVPPEAGPSVMRSFL
ncbi:hypothetical protein TNCV_2046331 [Trichonephila clavipes]|uniref:Uncharacterized protein n=1 Tax=Trichonephila clavipes TaxID=2585209 RepID=A0A8X6SQR9_TRICX|nr:hypothetical protein TNCV_2046331 [Trichonephila clavipes]